MKKLLLILSLTFISCSNDDNQEQCNCNAWVRLEENPVREVIPVELDCETGQPINLPEGYTFLGCDNNDIP